MMEFQLESLNGRVAMQKCFSGHRHYVQGVAWDPLGEHILTNSTDRTMRVHKARAGKKQNRTDVTDIQAAGDFVQTASVFKRPLTAAEEKQQPQQPSAPTETPTQPAALDASTQPNGASGTPPQKAQRKAANNTFVFQDESLNTFFRRLSFSPEGSFLVAPAATLGPLAPAPRCDSAAAAAAMHVPCWNPRAGRHAFFLHAWYLRLPSVAASQCPP